MFISRRRPLWWIKSKPPENCWVKQHERDLVGLTRRSGLFTVQESPWGLMQWSSTHRPNLQTSPRYAWVALGGPPSNQVSRRPQSAQMSTSKSKSCSHVRGRQNDPFQGSSIRASLARLDNRDTSVMFPRQQGQGTLVRKFQIHFPYSN